MKNTVAEIEDSLARYRDLSEQANATALDAFIDAILGADYFEDESRRSEYTDEDMMQEKDEALASILGNIIGDEVEELASATDLLSRFEDFAPKYSLDGTVGGEMEDGERDTLTTAYFDAVEAALRDKAPEEVKGIISVPGEFRILAKHILGIRGGGLNMYKREHVLDFWDDGGISQLPSRILAPDNIPGIHAVKSRVALGWNQATSLDGALTCIFVQETDDTWAWSFLWSGYYETQIFSITELLDWVFNTTEPDLGYFLAGYSFEDVMDGGFRGF